MAFGVLYDFTGNSNVSKVIKARDLVKESWFLDAVNYSKPVDLFILLGHNPIRTTVSSSTFGTIYSTIRGLRPNVPIQVFGGHTHIRFVYLAEGFVMRLLMVSIETLLSMIPSLQVLSQVCCYRILAKPSLSTSSHESQVVTAKH